MERLEGGADEIRSKLKRSHRLLGGKARADPMECVEVSSRIEDWSPSLSEMGSAQRKEEPGGWEK
ncbi:uncharacterized protein N7496_001301 [Penicillium cataractarum]|uniref:Uncharacterized protein n=1 Tax=Penicillium cataractarum TaxID=2100454 RepID=A0A9W9VVT8_9EURO|nr:uncharacterized protein N7496_001301 [Penicillium cataractarum]KAJ5390233.1 hypothetical protein N7496_001301 [Penicillium cataractarum]